MMTRPATTRRAGRSEPIGRTDLIRLSRSGAALTPAHSRRGRPGTHGTDISDGAGSRRIGSEGEATRFPLPPGVSRSILGSIGLFILAFLLLAPTGLSAQTPTRPASSTTPVLPRSDVDTTRTESTTPAVPSSPEEITAIERIRPDEPVDLALETYLRRDRSDSTIFTRGTENGRDLLAPDDLRLALRLGREATGTIPLRGYPAADEPTVPIRPFYIDGSYGLHSTAHLAAGLSGSTWPFDYALTLDYESTDGWVDGGERTSYGAEASGGYIIGLGHGIFSGGYMGADAAWRTSSYRLYALGPEAPQRSSVAWHLGGNTQAGVGPIRLDGSARIGRFAIEERDDATSGSEGAPSAAPEQFAATDLSGEATASISQGIIDWYGTLGLGTVITDGNDLPHAELAVGARLDLGFLRLGAGGRVDVAGSTDLPDDLELRPTAQIRIAPFDGLVLSGHLDGGIRRLPPREIFAINPYTAFDADWRPEIEEIGYALLIEIEPTRHLSLRVDASRRTFERYLLFGMVESGRFTPTYEALSLDRLDADFSATLAGNELAAALRYTDPTRENGEPIPYVPTFDATLGYRHRLGSPTTLGGSIRTIGRRTGAGGNSLDPVILLSLDAAYSLTTNIDLTLDVRNLLDVDYQRWSGYREPGLGAALGIEAKW